MSYTRRRKPPPPPPLPPVKSLKISKSLFSSQNPYNRTLRGKLPDFLRQPESSEGFTDTDSTDTTITMTNVPDIDTTITMTNVPDIVRKAKETPHYQAWKSFFHRARRNPADEEWTDDSDIEGGRRRKRRRRSKSRRKSQQTKRKWSRKYKRSINCKQPRGFSQKQYCKYGRNN
jgi:hypothetical protein